MDVSAQLRLTGATAKSISLGWGANVLVIMSLGYYSRAPQRAADRTTASPLIHVRRAPVLLERAVLPPALGAVQVRALAAAHRRVLVADTCCQR